jgi:hypothetical protein
MLSFFVIISLFLFFLKTLKLVWKYVQYVWTNFKYTEMIALNIHGTLKMDDIGGGTSFIVETLPQLIHAFGGYLG